MLATLVIFLRESVEASMIVAILLAYLNRIGRREHFRDVFLGVGAALVLATAGGAVAYETISSYDGSRAQTIFETVTYLMAATGRACASRTSCRSTRSPRPGRSRSRRSSAPASRRSC